LSLTISAANKEQFYYNITVHPRPCAIS